jgi:hypothetical protein
MRNSGTLGLLAALVVLVPGGALAQQFVTTHELAGFTSSSFSGNQGIFTYTSQCQADFGPTARMCDSLEVVRTTNVPSGLAGLAWVRSVYSGIASFDVSGAVVTGLDCRAWSDATQSGLTVSDSGKMVEVQCSAVLQVACCTPTPTTTASLVPSLQPWAHSLLAVLLLSAAGGMLLFRGRPVLGSGQRAVERRE